jgi:putative ABC transport system permease protein
MTKTTPTTRFHFWLWLIRMIGVIVPRRLRADWRLEWEAELRHREVMLAEWDRLDVRHKVDLVKRSASAFWDALWLQQLRWEDEMIQDLRYGVRMLLKHRGYTAVAVLTLTLGIGANTAIFSVVNAVLLSPLPYGEADRLVMVGHSWSGAAPGPISSLNYRDCRELNHVFEETALVLNWGANLTGQDRPEWLTGLQVSASFFSTLKVNPIFGRTFVSEEDKPGNDHVVVLSYGFWQRRFGGDPHIVGKPVTLDDKPYSVIGIMPASFQFSRSGNVEIFVPGAPTPEMSMRYHRQWETFYMIGRLKPGIKFDQAQADLKVVTGQIRQQNPRWYPAESQWSLAARPLQEDFFGELQKPLFFLWGAIGFVLLIACANVANLSLARAASRRKEFSIRIALGAKRIRLMRQLLTESILLSLLGGIFGCILCIWSIPALLAMDPTKTFQTVPVKINGTVLLFSLAVSLLTGLIFGLLPAIYNSTANISETLKDAARNAGERFRIRNPKSILIMAEVALSIMLMIGAGLLLRSFDKVLHVNPGFDPQRLLSFYIALPEFRYKNNEQITEFYRQAFDRFRAIPGVESVGSTDNPPLAGGLSRDIFAIEGQTFDAAQQPSGTVSTVSPDYFTTMKIPLLTGRYFTEADTAETQDVAIIDDLMVKRYFAEKSPIGERLSIGGSKLMEIVGVVGHIKHKGLDEGPGDLQMYRPTFQGDKENGAAIMIRSGIDTPTLVANIQEAIQKLDKDQPIFHITTVAQNLRDITAQRRFIVLLLTFFAGCALALAAIGLFGVVGYSVNQRTHEIGIRMALGAQRLDVVKLIVGQSLRLTLIGVALGLGGAFWLSRLLTDLLFNVSATDPATFTLIPLLLTVVALVASYLPARRAMRVDPMIALREE